MNLEYTHKPDYYLFAQLLVRHIESYIHKHPDADNAIFDLRDVYEIFRQDFASTTTNLEGILHIADSYRVETLNGDQPLIPLYTTNFTEPLSYQGSAFLKLPKFP